MAQQNLTVNGNAVFQGSLTGTTSLGSQPIGSGTVILLPNSTPVALGQMVTVQNLSGANNEIITLGWATPASVPSSFHLNQLLQDGATSGEFIAWNGTAWTPSSFVPGSGTVTSVAVTVPAELSVAGSPITSSGTFAFSWASGTGSGGQGKVIATPAGGGAGAYAGRVLVAGDIPALAYLPSSTVVPANRPAASHNFLTAYDNTTGLFSIAQPAASDLSDSATSVGNVLRANGTSFVSAQLGVADVSGAAPSASPTLTGTVTAGAIVAASGGLAITSSGTDGIRLADNGNARGILVGGTVAGAGHIWLWSPAGSALVDVSDTGVAISGPSSFATANPTFFSAQGNGSKVQLSTGTTTTGDVVTYDSNGNTVDSGTLLSSLAPKASPVLTGTTQIGRLKTVDPDTAGTVSFAGGLTAAHTFVSAYTGTNPPVVIALPQFDLTGANADLWVTYQGSANNWTGFTLNNSQTQTGAVNYLVIDIG